MAVQVVAIIAAVVAWACNSEPESRSSTTADASATKPGPSEQPPQPRFPDTTDTSSHFTPDIPRYMPQPQSPAPLKPWYGKISLLGKSPCGPNSVITDIDSDGYGVCTNYGDQHRLFRVEASTITTLHQMDVFPDQVAGDSHGHWWVSALSFSLEDMGQWGVLKVGHGASSWHVFPTVSATDEELGFGQGLALSGDTLFITGISLFATTGQPPQNARVLTWNTQLSQYGPVTTVAGENPCSVGNAVVWGKERTMVVCAGAAASTSGPAQASRAYIMGVNSGIDTNTPLSLTGIAPAAELAVYQNGMALGTAGASAQIYILSTTPPHLPLAALTLPDAAPNVSHTLSTLAWHSAAPLLLAANAEEGRVAIWNLKNAAAPQLAGDSVVDDNPGDNHPITAAAWIQDRWVIAVGDQLIQVE